MALPHFGYQRIVLLKHFDEHGLVFYTNLGSRKASHLEHNQRVSLLFPWYPLERQVCFLGKAHRSYIRGVNQQHQ